MIVGRSAPNRGPRYFQNLFQTRRGDQTLAVQAERKVFSCSRTGLAAIEIISNHGRHLRIKELLSQTFPLPAVKVFMTYRTAWWEDYGFCQGAINSNMLVNQTIAFGGYAVKGGFATILVTYTWRSVEDFEELDRPHHHRFKNDGGEIPESLVPSTLLVDHCVQQMCQLLGMFFIVREIVG